MDGSAVTLHLVELTFFKNRFLTTTWPEFSESFGATVRSFRLHISSQSHHTIILQLSVEVANALSAALDGLIAAIMIFLLRRGMTGIKTYKFNLLFFFQMSLTNV